MKTIVINTEKSSVAKLFANLAKTMGLKSYTLNDKQKEDIALIRAIDEGMKSEKVSLKSTYEIIDKLIK